MQLPNWFKKIFGILGISFHKLYYFEEDLRKPIESIKSPIPIEINKATKEDIDEISKTEEDIDKYLKENSICYVAKNEDKIAGYAWINTDKILMNGVKIGHTAEKCVFSFGGFVFPKFRGKKVFKSLIATYYKEMKDRGYEFVGNLANVDNIPAVKARESFGARKKQVYVILLPFNLHIIFNGPIGKGKLISQNDSK